MAISMQNGLVSSFLQNPASPQSIRIATNAPASRRCTTLSMATPPSPRQGGGSLSMHAPPASLIGSRHESSKHGDAPSGISSPMNRADDAGRLSSQLTASGAGKRHSHSSVTSSASLLGNGSSSPDELPIQISASVASKFTPEKARLLRQKMRESESYHDRMYHSGLASRLA
ncbi:hypothetical protein CLOM_g20206 [Closterium sp. NIES-68]|nr:hypothetical protein CLOM_g20206 [Closterium sp. NIES-68]GJP77293.1 hypothetical protein CLOP_g7710 [Closterium sp. NIES-67]